MARFSPAPWLAAGLMAAAIATPARAEFACRNQLADGEVFFTAPVQVAGGFVCPSVVRSFPAERRMRQNRPALPTTRFTTGSIGPFTTGTIGPFTTGEIGPFTTGSIGPFTTFSNSIPPSPSRR